MPILGSLLPGLRDLRVPLAVGFIWMLTLAVVTSRWLTESSPAMPLLSDATQAFKSIPNSGLQVAALLTCAYLVGAVAAVTRVPRFLDRIFNSAAAADPDYFPDYRDEVAGFFGATYHDPPLPTDSVGMHVGTVIHLSPGLRRVLYARWLWLWPWVRRTLRELNRRFIPYRLNYGTVIRLDRLWDKVQYPPKPLYPRLLDLLQPPLESGNFGWRLESLIRARIDKVCGRGGSAASLLDTSSLSPVAKSLLADRLDPDDGPHRDGEGYEIRVRDALVRAIIGGLESDFESIVSRLQVQNPDLHERYDRLSSESEMRVGVALPLSALFIVTAAAYAWPALLFGLLLTTVLFVRGWQKRYEADSIVWSAVAYELIEVPELTLKPSRPPYRDN